MRRLLRATISALGAVTVIWRSGSTMRPSLVGVAAAAESEPGPPADRPHVGFKQCAACRFKQLMSRKETKHAGAFRLLSDKYRRGAACLKCHRAGFKDVESTIP